MTHQSLFLEGEDQNNKVIVISIGFSYLPQLNQTFPSSYSRSCYYQLLLSALKFLFSCILVQDKYIVTSQHISSVLPLQHYLTMSSLSTYHHFFIFHSPNPCPHLFLTQFRCHGPALNNPLSSICIFSSFFPSEELTV